MVMGLGGKKILVTGGAGFVGSHIVESLVAQGARVIVFDNISSGKIENLKAVEDDVEVIRGNILDYKSLLEAYRGVDIISHQAAQLEIFNGIDNPSEDLKINTIGTLNVLNAARESKVEKVVNASSACVYGQAQQIPQSEEHPTNPNWAYGVSKLAAEKYCQIYRDYFGIPIVSLRYGIVYGEREWFGRVLTMFIKRVMNSEPPVIFGDGKQIRDFIHVTDLVQMHNLCIERDEVDGKVFNVATSMGTTVGELANIVIECSGNSLSPLYEDLKEGAFSQYIPNRRRIPAELRSMVLSIDKAKKELGWSPKIPLKQGIVKEMNWASQNPGSWEIEGIVHI